MKFDREQLDTIITALKRCKDSNINKKKSHLLASERVKNSDEQYHKNRAEHYSQVSKIYGNLFEFILSNK